MIRILKRAGVVVGGVVLLAIVAVLVLPFIVNLERYRNMVASRASKALGREVTLQDLRVSLWGGVGVEARDFQIAQARGFGPGPFLEAEAVRVRVHLLPLLRGQVKVSTAVLERPRIRLTHTQDGRWSVDDLLKPHAAPSPPKPPAEIVRPGKVSVLGGLLLSELAVRNGEVTLLDQAWSPRLTLTLANLDLSLRQGSVSDPVEIRAQARIGGSEAGHIEAAGRISGSEADSPVLDATVTLRDVSVDPWQALVLGESRTKLSGSFSGQVKVTGSATRGAFAGNLNLKPVAIQVGEAFSKAVGEEASLSFEGRREDQGVSLPKVTITLKDVTATGSLRIPDLQTPRITFTANSAKVDLDRLLAKSAAKSAWLGGGVAHAAVPLQTRTASPGLVAQGRVDIGDLRFKSLTWSAVRADVRYQDGLVQLPDIRANFMDGKVTAKGELDLRPKTPRITLTSRLDNVATEPLVQALGTGSWTLRSTLNVESAVTFVGVSTPEILGSAAGGGSLLLKKGRLVGYKPLERLTEVLAPILVSQGIGVRLNEFEEVSGHYTLDKGMLQTKDLTLTKTEGTITALGSLGLLDSSLDFDVVAKLGRTTLEAKVTGTTSQPIVVPKLGRFQQRIETELDKALPEQQSKKLKELFKGLFGR